MIFHSLTFASPEESVENRARMYEYRNSLAHVQLIHCILLCSLPGAMQSTC